MKIEQLRTSLFICALAVIGALASGTHLRVSAAPSGSIVIRAERIYTVTNGVIQDGEIHIREGKIQQVGAGLDVPTSAREYTAKDVIPGNP